MKNEDNNYEVCRPLFEQIGVLTVTLQTTDKLLQQCLIYVLPDGDPLTLDRWESLDEKNRKKTLGQLLKTIQERAAFHDKIESLFNSFLKHRNLLIHRLDEIPGAGFETDEQRQELKQFLDVLTLENNAMFRFLTALVTALCRQVGIEEAVHSDVPEFRKSGFAQEIESLVAGVDSLVFAKPKSEKQ